MKVSYITNETSHKNIFGQGYYKFKINDSILKTHFKSLMKLSRMYDSKEKTGYIVENNREDFLKLHLEIENSDASKAKKSHEKSVKSYQKKREESSYKSKCDHEDLGSLGYKHGEIVSCPNCGKKTEVW